jgi:ATP-dependent helicase/nuclease subunit A
MMAEIIPHLLAKGSNDGKAGAALQEIDRYDLSALPQLENILLTGSGAKAPFTAKIGNFPTKPTQKVIAEQMPQLEQLMQRVEDAREARLALKAARKSYVLHRFAARFLDRYADEKQKRGWLDFDDLILKARALLTDKAVAAWVLFRIDGGIDHILVDEAQDTSPRQWDVIERLTDEFYSGAGARNEVDRTLFVVGDKKQSIYSFQGADPEELDRKGATFEQKIGEAGQFFQRRSLAYSFRSSSAILQAVDGVFDPAIQTGFTNDGHMAFKDRLPGRVDLWPFIEKAGPDRSRGPPQRAASHGATGRTHRAADQGANHRSALPARRQQGRLGAAAYPTGGFPDPRAAPLGFVFRNYSRLQSGGTAYRRGGSAEGRSRARGARSGGDPVLPCHA